MSIETSVGGGGEVVVECGLEAPAERVWRALSVPELAADWLGAKPALGEGGGSDDTAANRFEIVEAQPFSRLTYRWRDGSPEAPGESFVTVEIAPRGPQNTWFRLTHRPPAVRPAAANGNTPMALAA
ncbi:SRPBCC domain-containing protein [Mesorhizobium sp. LHD-90]|uniref:SRPBCC family protein n=1 Tax=Mesorhizobium sp. LHD-90 TaxID=3071414 RepID=UPI0027DF9ABD|nr:SRPBCC domain-containing protein [Mesorhizobium sp. LHD-90]MDQ6437742.1 SRPBCC domain-containing protein [Mesorhizobium sp. LHD-90]